MTPRKKIYLFLIIFAFIFLSFLILIIPYFLKEIKRNSQDLISFKNEFASLKEEEKNIKDLEIIYQNYQENLTRIDKMLVNSKEPIEFIDFLEKDAQNFNQKIKISLMSKTEIKEDPWPTLNFQIQISGSFTDFLKFLERLENSPYLIEIENLNIKESGEGELAGTSIEASFLTKVFTK